MLRKLLFVLCIASGLSARVMAESIAIHQESMKSTLTNTKIVVIGEVVEVLASYKEKSGNCFSFLYRFKVLESMKGNLKEGELITIGLNLRTLDVKNGQMHLVLLNQMPDSFLNYCKFEKPAQITQQDQIYILPSSSISIYELKEKDSSTRYRGVTCNSRKKFLFEPVHTEKETQNNACRTVEGDFKYIRSILENEILN